MGFQRFIEKVESGDGDLDMVLFAIILLGAIAGIAARHFTN